ncbi:hypothetical protein AVEN_28521-1 [Araneus ventricosus]|uniref:Uncharacterized protein n=1 Tax=Araneus ventricosus TaxID=182803 RepID=A0A4Y2S9J8_ARAVE|nr:hypothetical protein AVEN_28521-1 [Araneus ventricosus]
MFQGFISGERPEARFHSSISSSSTAKLTGVRAGLEPIGPIAPNRSPRQSSERNVLKLIQIKIRDRFDFITLSLGIFEFIFSNSIANQCCQHFLLPLADTVSEVNSRGQLSLL